MLGDYNIDRNEDKILELFKFFFFELIYFLFFRMEDDYDEEDSDLDIER